MRLYLFAICTLFLTFTLLAQNVNIPDANFKNYLVTNTAINTNGDGEISVAEAASFTGAIKVFDKGITDLTGIEEFIKLTTLNCAYNKLNKLNISKNIGLIFLYCGQNPLTTLDVSKNLSLITIDCYDNQLTTLDVSNTIKLTSLYCYNNQLTALDVSKNSALTIFDCSNNMLTTLDVSKNTALKDLSCHNNKLTALDVSNKTYLTTLYCFNNFLTTLDASRNTSLINLVCYNNSLTTINISLNTALKDLSCFNNALTTLDVSNTIKLTSLYCYNNQLTTLDVSKNSALTLFDCNSNKLTTLDVSNNTALTNLDCDNNKLTTLDVSKNSALTSLSCGNNYLTTLDVTKNTSLTKLVCYYNSLTTIDLRNGNNTAITQFNASNNPNLYCISVDDVAWAADNLKYIDFQTVYNTNCLDNGFQSYFTSDLTASEFPFLVKFTDQSRGIPTNWFWDFGDGNTSTAQHTEHTFTKPGDYTVSLQVTNGADTSYYSQKITATPRATVREKINPFVGKGRSEAVSFVIDTMAYIGLGRDADSCFTDMWQFNPLTDTWKEVAPFPGKARSGAVVFVINEKAYVGLGRNQVSSALYNDFYSYNPKENAWKQVADYGGTARNNPVAFAIADTAYVGTGSNSNGSTNNFWKYNPTTNQWTEITGFTGKKRSSAVAFVIDGKGYVSGGDDITENGTTIMSDVQEYNPNTGLWKEKVFADGINLSFNSATAIGEGKTAFIMYGNKKKVVSYNPQTNNVEDLGDLLNLQKERYNGLSFFLNGVAYFGLGVTYGGFAENYASTYNNDIQHIDLPFVFAPEDILLSNDTISENSESGTVIGIFSTVDKTEVDAFTYEITDGFNLYIEKDSLKAFATDFEIDSVYNITVKTTDTDGFSFEKAFTIKVKDVNEAPWKLEIVGDTVLSGAPMGTLVGKFLAYDEDTTDTHTFKFDASRSDVDTTFYNIIGDSLVVADIINKDDLMHSFYVLAIDRGGLELSREIFIDIIEGVGIRLVENTANLFDIYPNPVDDFVTVQAKMGDAKITELVLLNAMGKTISKTENIDATNHKLNMGVHKSGIYFLMLRTAQGTYIQKIVKD